jgi:hypothetical protein
MWKGKVKMKPYTVKESIKEAEKFIKIAKRNLKENTYKGKDGFEHFGFPDKKNAQLKRQSHILSEILVNLRKESMYW